MDRLTFSNIDDRDSFVLPSLTGMKRVTFTRKLRDDLTPQQLFNLEEYGSIHFESAGARRQK